MLDGASAPPSCSALYNCLARNAPGAAEPAPPGGASDALARGGGSASRASEKSIAVLPFTNLSAEKDSEYFSDGLAEEILNALSQVQQADRRSTQLFVLLQGQGDGCRRDCPTAARRTCPRGCSGAVRFDAAHHGGAAHPCTMGFQLWSEGSPPEDGGHIRQSGCHRHGHRRAAAPPAGLGRPSGWRTSKPTSST